MKIFSIYTCFLLTLMACQSNLNKTDEPIVAQVHNKKLYLSDLEKLITASMTKEDSIQIVNAFIDNWIRESLIMHEAEKSFAGNLDLRQLVEDYHSSLILFHYEKKIIEEKLDTVVQGSIIQEYYENNASDFILSEPIIKARFAKFSEESSVIRQFKDAWKKNEEEKIRSLSKQYAEISMIDTTTWFKISEITQVFPPSGLREKSIKRGRDLQISEGGYEYFLKIEDFRDKNEITPLAYIKDQIIQIILHKRKTKILSDFENSLLQKETNKNNVKLFIQ